MTSGGNNFNDFLRIKLPNFVQFEQYQDKLMGPRVLWFKATIFTTVNINSLNIDTYRVSQKVEPQTHRHNSVKS